MFYWNYCASLGNILKIVMSNALIMTINNIIIMMTYMIDEESGLLMTWKVH